MDLGCVIAFTTCTTISFILCDGNDNEKQGTEKKYDCV